MGVNGSNGTNGKDGTGIKSVTLSSDGNLSILLTDNTVCNLGISKAKKEIREIKAIKVLTARMVKMVEV